MTTERLIVELDAKTQKLESALTRVEEDLKGVSSETKKADSNLKKMSAGAGIAADAVLKTATAGLALATALTAVVLNSASAQAELEILSRQAKLSTDDFEALSFATKQYGVNAEQIADISKDLSDKLGEFGKVGTGAFQDFADVAGLTTEQAKKTAIELQNLSSDQVIGEMVRQLEDAGATGSEVTFVLESMGNDLSKLTPLFTDNARELNKLVGIYKSATAQMKLTNEEVEGLKSVATSFDLATDAMSKAGTLISAQLAPLLDEFFGGVIDVVPQATQTIVDFINAFKSAEQIKSIDSINRLIEEQKALVQELRIEQTELGNTFATMLDSDKSIAIQKEQLNLQIEEEVQRIDELIIARDKLTEQESAAEEARIARGEIGGTFDASSQSSSTGGTGDEIQAIADRFKTEEELLAQKLENDLVIIGDNNILKEQLYEEYLLNLIELEENSTNESIALAEKRQKAIDDTYKQTQRSAEKEAKGKANAEEGFVDASIKLSGVLLEDNKAVRYGMAVADTAGGIMKAFSTSATIYDAYVNAAAVAITGVAQLASISSSSKGSGGTSTPTSAPPPQPPAETQEELSTIDIDSQDATRESTSITVKFEGSGDDITEAIAKNMKVMEFNGVLES